MKIKTKKIEKQEDKFEDEDNGMTILPFEIIKPKSKKKDTVTEDGHQEAMISKKIDSGGAVNKNNQIGKAIGLGTANMVGRQDLQFRKVKGRREFMDSIKSYIQEKGRIEYSKLDAYFQYTTGASTTLIQQCLAVMENLGLIACEEVHIDSSRYVDVYYIPEGTMKNTKEIVFNNKEFQMALIKYVKSIDNIPLEWKRDYDFFRKKAHNELFEILGIKRDSKEGEKLELYINKFIIGTSESVSNKKFAMINSCKSQKELDELQKKLEFLKRWEQ